MLTNAGIRIIRERQTIPPLDDTVVRSATAGVERIGIVNKTKNVLNIALRIDRLPISPFDTPAHWFNAEKGMGFLATAGEHGAPAWTNGGGR